MWVEITVAVIALLGTSAIGGYLSWFFFFKDNRKAYIARVRKEISENRSQEYKIQREHMDRIEKDVDEMRQNLYQEKAERALERAEMERYREELNLHKKHMAVLFKMCKCQKTEEVQRIREFYEKWFLDGEGNAPDAAASV